MWQFILLDGASRRAWHVQWGFEEKNRRIRELKNSIDNSSAIPLQYVVAKGLRLYYTITLFLKYSPMTS